MRVTGRATVRPTATAQSAAGDRRRVGGRFWALAESDEEDADDDGNASAAGSPSSPTPSDLICDLFHAGYSEDEVAMTIDQDLPPDDPARIGLHAGEKHEMIRRVVHRKTAALALKPWKGPLPKVSLPNLTLFDMIRPESWITVKKKKNARRLAVRQAPAALVMAASATEISNARLLMSCDGPVRTESGPHGVGPESDGYEAHAGPGHTPVHIVIPCTYEGDRGSISRAPSLPGSRVRKHGTRGFPVCGARRARRIRPLLDMAGRGAAPPPAKSSGPAGRGGAVPSPAAGAGRGSLAPPGQRPPAGGGVVQGNPGRGFGHSGVQPPGQVPLAAGRGGLRPPAPAAAPVTSQAAGRGGPRSLAPGVTGVAPAGRDGIALGVGPTPSGGQPRAAPPPHYVARPAQNRTGPAQTRLISSNREPNDPPRDQWGDDGFDAYGDGQHRGSSSTGGGRGYAWQSDGSAERPFLGPPGGFVEGASGPDHRQRGGYRGRRGGGRGRFRRPPSPPAVVDHAASAVETDHTSTDLPTQAMEVVTALASVEVPETGTVADRSDAERASKYARKKEKMLCYRCGEKGHFIAECVAELCESCGKPAHASGECPLLRDQALLLTMYGVCCVELMFFESPVAREIPEETLSLTTGIVKATQGEVTEAQIVRRLQELVPGDFRWELVLLENNVFKVDFPRWMICRDC
ncbi:spidroin-2-like [Triticum urartu]|uniref:spidroin-2-like n=1 Tax=Triticum urartu TaxID=4572 RepID=UPI002042FA43|nr:spidroin-2-like [Triticum urartu]